MKELTEEFKSSTVAKEIVIPKKTEKVLTGQTNPLPGLTFWEYEMETGDLRKAVFETRFVAPKERNVIGHRLDPMIHDQRDTVHLVLKKKDKCIYFQALNRKTAKRKLEKRDYYVKPLEK